MPYRDSPKQNIQYEDFYPLETSKKTIFYPAAYEPLHMVMESVNEWLNENEQFEVINIETVVLPNMHKNNKKRGESTSLRAAGYDGQSTYWHQFIRVWYRKKPKDI